MGQIISVFLWTAALFAAIILNLALKPKSAQRIVLGSIIVTAIGGLLIYSYSYACLETSLPVAVIRTAFATIRIFVGEDAFGDIESIPAASNPLFLVVFWTLHVVGLFSTTSAAITTFGAGLLRKARLWLRRRTHVAVIFGLNEATLDFGRRLIEQEEVALVFVDESPDEALSGAAEQLGSVLRSDADALEASQRFIKSMGLRPGKRCVWLYALNDNLVEDHRYAGAFLRSLERQKLLPEQTGLTIRGHEDDTDNHFQAKPGAYGFGSVIAINEPEMAARLLMRSYPPSGTLTFDENGKATRNFHALLIGFGRVGQAVLRQLVMNGQFEGSHFKVAVFDPEYEQMMGRVSMECSEMLAQYDIAFYSHDGRSCQLYRYLAQHMDDVRYIVVCAGSGEVNGEICEDLRTFVDHRGGAASIYMANHRGIRCWAKDQTVQHDVYTPEILCSDMIDRMAMVLNQTYCGTGTARENWEKCDYFSRMSSRASADFADSLLRAAGITGEEALRHWDPKGELMENLAKTEHLRWCAFHYAMGFRAMTREEFDARGKAHAEEKAAAGSSKLRIGKDMPNRVHACLVPWEELDDLSARENAYTGGHVDYKEMDRRNIRSLPGVLKAMKEET